MADYVHCIDTDQLEVWPDFFTDDAHHRVCTRENYDRGLPLSVMSCSGRGMLRDRISALRTANVFEPHVYCHVTGALRILAFSAGRVQTESNFQVVRTMSTGQCRSLPVAARSIRSPSSAKFSNSWKEPSFWILVRSTR
jgi:anthranilate 1,2-dioxygenase small subunit